MFAFAGPVLAANDETRFLLQGGLEQNLGGGFLAYFTLSYLVRLEGSSHPPRRERNDVQDPGGRARCSPWPTW
jgi:hypothetical protein